jgi:hypothetical protein
MESLDTQGLSNCPAREQEARAAEHHPCADQNQLQVAVAIDFHGQVNKTGVTGAVLIAPGATTHSNDMHQRGVKLAVTPSGNTLAVSLPPSAAEVPPGYYMLFVLDKAGIPSTAKFIQVS